MPFAYFGTNKTAFFCIWNTESIIAYCKTKDFRQRGFPV